MKLYLFTEEVEMSLRGFQQPHGRHREMVAIATDDGSESSGSGS